MADRPKGAPIWIDLLTADAERAKSFYGEIFGWEADAAPPEFGGYITFTKDGNKVAGCMPKEASNERPDKWLIYLEVENAKEAADAVVENGGKVWDAPQDVMDLGTMAIVTDSTDATIALWQPGTHKGFTLNNEPGYPNWFELHTTQHAKTMDFYRKVFGWMTFAPMDTDEFRYHLLGTGPEDQAAGVMDASAFMPKDIPAEWGIYFKVANADESLAQTVELGGKILREAEDTPFGRLAQAEDPMGAMFKLIQN